MIANNPNHNDLSIPKHNKKVYQTSTDNLGPFVSCYYKAPNYEEKHNICREGNKVFYGRKNTAINKIIESTVLLDQKQFISPNYQTKCHVISTSKNDSSNQTISTTSDAISVHSEPKPKIKVVTKNPLLVDKIRKYKEIKVIKSKTACSLCSSAQTKNRACSVINLDQDYKEEYVEPVEPPKVQNSSSYEERKNEILDKLIYAADANVNAAKNPLDRTARLQRLLNKLLILKERQRKQRNWNEFMRRLKMSDNKSLIESVLQTPIDYTTENDEKNSTSKTNYNNPNFVYSTPAKSVYDPANETIHNYIQRKYKTNNAQININNKPSATQLIESTAHQIIKRETPQLTPYRFCSFDCRRDSRNISLTLTNSTDRNYRCKKVNDPNKYCREKISKELRNDVINECVVTKTSDSTSMETKITNLIRSVNSLLIEIRSKKVYSNAQEKYLDNKNKRNNYYTCANSVNYALCSRDKSVEVSKSFLNTVNTKMSRGCMGDSSIAATGTEVKGFLSMIRMVVPVNAIRKLITYVPFIDHHYFTMISQTLSGKENTRYTCNICQEAFENTDRLGRHVGMSHLSKVRDCCVCRHSLDVQRQQSGVFRCKYCNSMFTRAYCCELHQQSCAERLGIRHEAKSNLLLLK